MPSGSYESEKAIMEELETFDEVDSTMGLANIEAIDGYHLGDKLNPRQLSELIGMDYEVVQSLYAMYAVEHDLYGELLGGIEEYSVPLFDMFIFLKDQMDSYNINLSGEDMEMMTEMLDQLEMVLEIEEADRRCLQDLKLAAQQVEQAKAELETQQKALHGKRAELEQLLIDIEQNRVEVEDLIIQIEARGDEYLEMMENL